MESRRRGSFDPIRVAACWAVPTVTSFAWQMEWIHDPYFTMALIFSLILTVSTTTIWCVCVFTCVLPVPVIKQYTNNRRLGNKMSSKMKQTAKKLAQFEAFIFTVMHLNSATVYFSPLESILNDIMLDNSHIFVVMMMNSHNIALLFFCLAKVALLRAWMQCLFLIGQNRGK